MLSRLAAAAEAAGNVPRAIDAFRRVYFEYPLSIESSIAEAALTRLNAWSEDDPQTALELKRADVLFQARRWEAARTSYERARDGATGAERDRVTLRMAAADVQLKRYRQARDPLARADSAGPTRTKRTSTTSARCGASGNGTSSSGWDAASPTAVPKAPSRRRC